MGHGSGSGTGNRRKGGAKNQGILPTPKGGGSPSGGGGARGSGADLSAMFGAQGNGTIFLQQNLQQAQMAAQHTYCNMINRGLNPLEQDAFQQALGAFFQVLTGSAGGGGGGGGGGNSGADSAQRAREAAREAETRAAYEASLRRRKGGAWKPDVNDAPVAKLEKKVKSALNKLTLQNFDSLLKEIATYEIDSAFALRAVINVVFEKALAETHFSTVYAQLCAGLADELPEIKENGEALVFKKLLVTRCQEEFEARPLLSKEEKDAGKSEIQQWKEDLVKRRRMIGNVTFIGELFKKNMIGEKVMHTCVQQLLGPEEGELAEEEIESLCKLLTNVGKQLDRKEAGKYVDYYFKRIHSMKDNKDISSRVRFMLRDLVELRAKKWRPRKKNDVEMKTQDALRKQLGYVPPPPEQPRPQRQGRHGGRGQHGGHGGQHGGQGHGGQGHGGPAMPAAFGGARMGGAPGGAGGAGGMGMRASSTHDPRNVTQGIMTGRVEFKVAASKQKAAPAPVKVEVPRLSEDELHTQSMMAVKEYLSAEDTNEAIRCITELRSPDYHPQIIELALQLGLEGKTRERALIGAFLAAMCGSGLFSEEQVVAGVADQVKVLPDLLMDFPLAAQYLEEMLTHTMLRGGVSIKRIPDVFAPIAPIEGGKLRDLMVRVFKTIIDADSAERARGVYAKGGVDFVSWMPESERGAEAVSAVLAAAGLDGLDPLLALEQAVVAALHEPSTGAKALWGIISGKAGGADADELRNPAFVRRIVRAMLSFQYGKGAPTDKAGKAGEEKFWETYAVVLEKLARTTPLQLHTLFEVQLFCHYAGFPAGLMQRIFNALYFHDVVAEDSFDKWRENMTDETPGKSKALFQVNSWLTWLANAEEEGSDEEESSEEDELPPNPNRM